MWIEKVTNSKGTRYKYREWSYVKISDKLN